MNSRIVVLIIVLGAAILYFASSQEKEVASSIEPEVTKEVAKTPEPKKTPAITNKVVSQTPEKPRKHSERKLLRETTSKQKEPSIAQEEMAPMNEEVTPDADMINEMTKEIIKTQIQMLYGHFFENFNGTEEEKSALQTHLQTLFSAQQQLGMKLLDPSVTDDEILFAQDEAHRKARAELESHVSQEQLTKFDDHNTHAQENMFRNRLEIQMTSINVSSQVKEKVIDIFTAQELAITAASPFQGDINQSPTRSFHKNNISTIRQMAQGQNPNLLQEEIQRNMTAKSDFIQKGALIKAIEDATDLTEAEKKEAKENITAFNSVFAGELPQQDNNEG